MSSSTGPSLEERLVTALAPHIEGGRVPGLVALVGREASDGPGGPVGDEPVVVVLGGRAVGGPPLGRDGLFRVASMTKPVTAVVALMLMEEGLLALDDPVEEWLPELADRRVLRTMESELDDTVPAERSITVDDLLTFRMGFGAVLAPPGTYPVQRAEEESGIRTMGPPWPTPPFDAGEWLARFASLPLMAQPGATWLYNTGSQLLGILLERATGTELEVLFAERVFDPLGMADTTFTVPRASVDRLTTAYEVDPQSGELVVTDPASTSMYREPPPFANAAAGLVSTADDWWRFTGLLTGGGAVGDTRLLSEASVGLMTADHLTRRQRLGASLFLGPGGSWGLGLRVPAEGADPDAVAPVYRGYGWDGGRGTCWRSGVSGRTGILLTQVAMTSPEPPAVFVDFWSAVAGEPGDTTPPGR